MGRYVRLADQANHYEDLFTFKVHQLSNPNDQARRVQAAWLAGYRAAVKARRRSSKQREVGHD